MADPREARSPRPEGSARRRETAEPARDGRSETGPAPRARSARGVRHGLAERAQETPQGAPERTRIDPVLPSSARNLAPLGPRRSYRTFSSAVYSAPTPSATPLYVQAPSQQFTPSESGRLFFTASTTPRFAICSA